MFIGRSRFLVIACSLFVCAGFAAAEEEVKTKSVTFFNDSASLDVPTSFESAPPKSRMLQYEFKVGEEDKAARLTMMAAGGGVDPNIKRWKGQFSGGDPKEQKSEKIQVDGWDVHIVDCSGSFSERMGGPFAGGKVVQRENWAMLGGIIAQPEGRLFFVKLTGPAETVKANRKAFVAMLKSLKH
ncbi:MAG: hypothetical protein AAFX06_00825 [Planctomycetota bacterium]